MCGIAGMLSAPEAPPVDAAELAAVSLAMRARGPDGDGLWIAPDGRAALAHRRLAIIAPGPGAAQPMTTPDGRYVITFNGEIYNFRDLRADLVARGVALRTGGDTEVLLHLYALFGPDLLARVRGMYAFAIWDTRKRELFLARDPLGIKPLYLADDGRSLRFASSVKALLAGGGVPDAPDPAGHAGFHLWGSVPEPYTTCRAIRALPAGHWLRASPDGRRLTRCHFNVRDEIMSAEAQPPIAPAQARERFTSLVRDSLAAHLVADVPVGVFLSAGIDSAAIAAMASRASPGRLTALTLGFAEYAGTAADEVPLASAIAATCGAHHAVHRVDADAFDAAVPQILAAMDQPSIDGVNTWLVSRAAAATGLKVALSGLGGDELLGGYPSFTQVPALARRLRPFAALPAAGRLARRLAAPLVTRVASPKYAGLLEHGGTVPGAWLLRRALHMPFELERLLDPEMARAGLEELRTEERLAEAVRGIRDPRLQVMALEMQWYLRNQLLRDADWAGMAWSIEIRTPLVDATLLRGALPLLCGPDPPGKLDLARCAPLALPEAVVRRPKTGFQVPVSRWLAGATLGSSRTPARGLRQWARRVNPAPLAPRRVLALVTDAYGGFGGISRYNCDMLLAMATHAGSRRVTVLPRLARAHDEPVPSAIDFRTGAAGGKLRYVRSVLAALRHPDIDAVVCGHINLLAPAILAGRWSGAPVILVIHGIDAWQPPRARLARWLAGRVTLVVAVSEVTRARFLDWVRPRPAACIIPNAIRVEEYGPGPKPDYLLDRYGLRGRRILLTLGRIDAAERYKGFDEVLDVLPDVARREPSIAYLVAGDGSDLPRLRRRAADPALAEFVRFTGRVPDAEKVDHYRLADAYVMPSRGEGFGRVFLEALACGIPAVASSADGGREAVRDGLLGEVVDPGDPRDLVRGIEAALARGRGAVPGGIEWFGWPRVEGLWHGLLDRLPHH